MVDCEWVGCVCGGGGGGGWCKTLHILTYSPKATVAALTAYMAWYVYTDHVHSEGSKLSHSKYIYF